jgi:general secretion pathway protein G
MEMSRFSPIAKFASPNKQEQKVQPGSLPEVPNSAAEALTARRVRRNRRGFTLLELLLVMAIIVVLASITTVAVLKFRENSSKDAAFTQISMLSKACTAYNLNVGFFPNSLNDLVTLPTGMNQNQWRGPYLESRTVPLDPWGQPYVLGASTGERLIISSNGPDRQAGTQDDINNDR